MFGRLRSTSDAPAVTSTSSYSKKEEASRKVSTNSVSSSGLTHSSSTSPSSSSTSTSSSKHHHHHHRQGHPQQQIMDDLLSCPVCLEEYQVDSSGTREPLFLQCHHSICRVCLPRLVKSYSGQSRFSSKDSAELPCPECRMVTVVPPGGLTQNFYLIHTQPHETTQLHPHTHTTIYPHNHTELHNLHIHPPLHIHTHPTPTHTTTSHTPPPSTYTHPTPTTQHNIILPQQQPHSQPHETRTPTAKPPPQPPNSSTHLSLSVVCGMWCRECDSVALESCSNHQVVHLSTILANTVESYCNNRKHLTTVLQNRAEKKGKEAQEVQEAVEQLDRAAAVLRRKLVARLDLATLSQATANSLLQEIDKMNRRVQAHGKLIEPSSAKTSLEGGDHEGGGAGGPEGVSERKISPPGKGDSPDVAGVLLSSSLRETRLDLRDANKEDVDLISLEYQTSPSRQAPPEALLEMFRRAIEALDEGH
ncbi:zinc finger, C3HC4 type [Penaeus vannamei]|uniref:Zinc finger, C3HC4 type n=1 Tax=Penaeus vannamei TaxID=6689 RepID=A0A423UB16_PENVA|nr:zinc finger, C3HC4 type [Penaeus vannamei]